MFKTNEGNIDRIVRVAVGVAALVVFFMNQGTPLGWVALVVAVLGLFTGLVGWCALYSVFGINTCKTKS